MKPTTTKALPVIRVTKVPPGTKKETPANKDIAMYDTLMAIVTASNRARSRVDGVEARLAHVEALLARQGSR